MKKVALLLLLITSIAQINAQKIGIVSGINISNMVMNNELFRNPYNNIYGFHVGALVDFRIKNGFSIETGLLLNTKGCSIGKSPNIDVTRIYSFDIPITAKLLFSINKDLALFAKAGGYLGCSIAGSIDKGDEWGGNSNIKWGSDKNSDLKRFDYGLSFGIGMQNKSVIFGLTYNIGLYNIGPNQGYLSNTTNNVFQLGVGYLF